MKMKKAIAFLLAAVMVCAFVPSVFAETDEYGEVLLHYTFDDDTDCGEVFGNTRIENGYASFDGAPESYIKMPDNITAGVNTLTFVINVRPEMGEANQFTFTIGSSDTEYIFLNTNRTNSRSYFAITTGSYGSENAIEADPVLSGEWKSIAITVDNSAMAMYFDGEKVAEGETSVLPAALENTTANYLAKSQYSGDPTFEGYISDFAIYSEVLTEEEIKGIAAAHAEEDVEANVYIAKSDLEEAADTIGFDSMTIGENLTLPETASYASVTWTSSDPSVISDSGEVTVSGWRREVTMTATVTDGTYETMREFVFTVISLDECFDSDVESLCLVGNLEHLKENLYLPTAGTYGSSITWTSSDESVITSEGVITQNPVGGGSKEATLTATIALGTESTTKEFDVTVEETDAAYLFAYFTGNSSSSERMFYGISYDGYNFNTINGGNPVLVEGVGTGCLRDPFIFRGQDGYYYCLVTDMQSSLGWSSNYRLTTYKSKDLITWTDETLLDCREIFGKENLTRAWAPQAIWDPEYYDEQSGEYGAYMIYFAVKLDGEDNNQTRMYKMYTKDMKTIISEPEFFYSSNGVYSSDIDADIVYKNGIYYMYVKDETQGGQGGVHVVTSEHAGGPYGERISQLPRKDTSGNDVAIEGSAIYKLIGQDRYNLIYDAYNNGFFVMSETEDLTTFNQLDRSTYSFDFTPRHGYVITISQAELDALLTKIPEAKTEPVVKYSFEDNLEDAASGFDAEMELPEYSEGISGKGLYLDGEAGSYAKIPSEAVSNFYDYTISAWYKTERDSNTQRVFDIGTGSDRYFFYTPYYGTDEARFAITTGSNGGEYGISVNTKTYVNSWNLVTVTSEGDKVCLYIG